MGKHIDSLKPGEFEKMSKVSPLFRIHDPANPLADTFMVAILGQCRLLQSWSYRDKTLSPISIPALFHHQELTSCVLDLDLHCWRLRHHYIRDIYLFLYAY